MHPAFPPPLPNLAAAANPMAAAAAANPFLALQLLGQAQQLQNLGFLAAAALQQQQAPFFPGGFTPKPNQFAPYAGGPPPAGFNGGGVFRPGGAGICGQRPPRPMMSPVGKGSNYNSNSASSGGAPRPILNVGKKDYNNSTGSGGTPRPILNDERKDRNSSGGGNGKKLSESHSDNQNKDKDSQLRRQELKEVLAKQQELGFELPELPPGYLSETEDQGDERKSNWKTQQRDSRFGHRGNTNKRQRFERGEFQSKRSKVWNRTPSVDGAVAKSREPTLLQKLLSADIKRDRHRLLHAFKFMALNSFFEDWPDKPLLFPSVKVNQIEIENNITTDDVDVLENAEMAKDSSLDINENGDRKELSSIDGEGSADHNEEDEDGASADSSDEDEVVDADEEQFNEPEDDAAF
ncbi:hypothetical protein BAE44_0000325 [Dichanthelium oligosanthes]|uniref:FMR1-interacting protein 1 conserved domain-containing protein n=1 Tax=Dichanthelium oligosanthes TaxID=888268 RepID=A0A1E5WMN0_9POAL|nr:hypothetical protein BAE44_0000325 [Dichanthelium oligosanthes]